MSGMLLIHVSDADLLNLKRLTSVYIFNISSISDMVYVSLFLFRVSNMLTSACSRFIGSDGYDLNTATSASIPK